MYLTLVRATHNDDASQVLEKMENQQRAELPGLSKRSRSLPGQCLSEITKDPPCFVFALYSQNLRYRQTEKVKNTLPETPSGGAVVVRLAAYHANSLQHCR